MCIPVILVTYVLIELAAHCSKKILHLSDCTVRSIASTVCILRSCTLIVIIWKYPNYQSFPGGATGKEPTCKCRIHKRCGFDPWVWKIPWKRAWQLNPAFLPWESHGQRSLEGYTPPDHRVRQDWSDLAQAWAGGWGCFPALLVIWLEAFQHWSLEVVEGS